MIRHIAVNRQCLNMLHILRPCWDQNQIECVAWKMCRKRHKIFKITEVKQLYKLSWKRLGWWIINPVIKITTNYTVPSNQQKAIKKGAKFLHEGTVCAWMAWAINNIDVDSLTMTRKGGPHQLKGRSLEGSRPMLNIRSSQGIYQGYTSTRSSSGCSPRNMSYRMWFGKSSSYYVNIRRE